MGKTLGDLAKSGYIAISTGPFGSALHAHDYQETGIPVIPTEAIEPGRLRHDRIVRISEQKARELARHRLQPGDIVFARRGVQACGLSAPVTKRDGEAIAGTGVITLRILAPEKVDPGFLACAVGAPISVTWLKQHAIGATMPNLNSSVVLELPIRLPDIQTQRAIARIFGTLDDKIDLCRRMNRTLEETARSVFKSWFVDFEPVRAKAEGRDRGLPKAVADLFPKHFEDSELGEIPAGWEVADIYGVADVIYGAPFQSDLFNEAGNGLPLIRIRDLSTHDPSVFTPEEHPKGCRVSAGDLVVGMDGEFRAHLWRGPQAWLNQRLCCFRPKQRVPRAFVHYSIEVPLRFFEDSKTGTTVIHLGKADIDTFRLVIPPSPILAAFGKIADPLDLRILSNAGESRALAVLRDTLLPKLLSGELRIKDAERFVVADSKPSESRLGLRAAAP